MSQYHLGGVTDRSSVYPNDLIDWGAYAVPGHIYGFSGSTQGGIGFQIAGVDRVNLHDPDVEVQARPIEFRTQGVDYFGSYQYGETVLVLPEGGYLFFHLDAYNEWYPDTGLPQVYGLGTQVSVEDGGPVEAVLVEWNNVGQTPDLVFWHGSETNDMFIGARTDWASKGAGYWWFGASAIGTLDVSTVVPEPGTLAVLALGLARLRSRNPRKRL